MWEKIRKFWRGKRMVGVDLIASTFHVNPVDLLKWRLGRIDKPPIFRGAGSVWCCYEREMRQRQDECDQ